MDETAQNTSNTSISNNKPPTDAFEPSNRDLINLFVQQQIQIWGFDQVQTWFEEGFDCIVVNGKVIWVK